MSHTLLNMFTWLSLIPGRTIHIILNERSQTPWVNVYSLLVELIWLLWLKL